jgi:(1->4)-alpha-D-glucan 1-alpha-D-glucosylmutase
MAKLEAVPIPRATYRLQLRKGFGFDRAAVLAPYFARLCIRHVYASPCLKGAARQHAIAACTSASSRSQRHFQFDGPPFATAINRRGTAQVEEAIEHYETGLAEGDGASRTGWGVPAIDQIEGAIVRLVRRSAEG